MDYYPILYVDSHTRRTHNYFIETSSMTSSDKPTFLYMVTFRLRNMLQCTQPETLLQGILRDILETAYVRCKDEVLNVRIRSESLDKGSIEIECPRCRKPFDRMFECPKVMEILLATVDPHNIEDCNATVSVVITMQSDVDEEDVCEIHKQ